MGLLGQNGQKALLFGYKKMMFLKILKFSWISCFLGDFYLESGVFMLIFIDF